MYKLMWVAHCRNTYVECMKIFRVHVDVSRPLSLLWASFSPMHAASEAHARVRSFSLTRSHTPTLSHKHVHTHGTASSQLSGYVSWSCQKHLECTWKASRRSRPNGCRAWRLPWLSARRSLSLSRAGLSLSLSWSLLFPALSCSLALSLALSPSHPPALLHVLPRALSLPLFFARSLSCSLSLSNDQCTNISLPGM